MEKEANGELLKILKTGPDALSIITNTPLYTVITYDHPILMGSTFSTSSNTSSKNQ